MMLKEIHFLLTYNCNHSCDHCFLYCGPEAGGTFSSEQLIEVFREMERIRTIQKVYFEGGEALLYFPLLIEGIRIARSHDFDVGIVTNAYWALSPKDARLWLAPLSEAGVSDIFFSDDTFHCGDEDDSAAIALKEARSLGMSAHSICIEEPRVEMRDGTEDEKGASIVGGGVVFRGRAVEKLSADLPHRSCDELNSCPYEDLENPDRVHVDAYGNVQLCQGLCIGNMWETPLSELIGSYSPASHPICSSLIEGGPALLAERQGIEHEDGYVDECHFCYTIRSALIDNFPDILAPKQVYGIES